MSQKRKAYYIWIPTGAIFQDRESSPWNFKIEASDDEIMQLRQHFNDLYAVGEANFYRAHIPFLEYHHDNENDEYDLTMQKVYDMIYRLGDDEAQQHIDKMGILQARPTDDGLMY